MSIRVGKESVRTLDMSVLGTVDAAVAVAVPSVEDVVPSVEESEEGAEPSDAVPPVEDAVSEVVPESKPSSAKGSRTRKKVK